MGESCQFFARWTLEKMGDEVKLLCRLSQGQLILAAHIASTSAVILNFPVITSMLIGEVAITRLFLPPI